jgi:hypothetical protein
MLQKQLLKVLSGKNYRFSTDMLHNEFELLKIKDIVKQEIITFVHNFFSNSLPPVLVVILKPLLAIIPETKEMAAISSKSQAILLILLLHP